MSDNLLINKYPKIASEWNYAKNGDLQPENFTCGSSCKVWWICGKKKHEWTVAINNRTKGTKCPFCLNENKGKSLQELFPDLVKEWHPTLNEELMPDEVTFGSNKSVWWLCEKNMNGKLR